MKKIISIIAIVCISISAMAQDVVRESLKIGSDLPKDVMKLHDVVSGNDAITGNPENGTLVIFSCNTCPYVIKSMPRMQEMLKYAESHSIAVVIINSNEAQRKDVDAPDAMKEFAKTHNYPDYLVDEGSKMADIFGASRTPEVFLFNKENKLVYKGAMDDNVPEPENAKEYFLKDAIDNMLSGKDIKPVETKSVGCSIKRV